jgi:hypothetical protein
MTKSSLPVLRDLLVGAGYRVLARTNGWAECFVQRDAERWEGRGLTEDEALDDALGKMFPSHLAWALLEQRAERPAVLAAPSDFEPDGVGAPANAPEARETIAAPIIDPAPDEARGDGGEPHTPEAVGLDGTSPSSTGQDAASTVPEPIPALDQPMMLAITTEPEVVLRPVAPLLVEVAAVAVLPIAEAAVAAPVETLERPLTLLADGPPAIPVDATPANEHAPEAVEEGAPKSALRAIEDVPQAPRLSARARAVEALDSVERLLSGIEERLGHLARMCGERQRLHMMVWICRARAIEEAHPGMRDVEQAVARVARRLTEIGKMFWPGSVRALQLSARPADVRREMHATWASDPANWREATALAERLLDEHLSKSPEAGLDEDGWADAAARTPHALEPDAMLDDVDGEIKALLVPPGEVPNGRAGDLSSADMDRLVNAARKLRWLRGTVRDDLAWGIAVGRLRRAVPSLGDRGGRVRDALDHRSKPPVPWAKVLGELPVEPTSPPGESPEDLKAALPAESVTKDGLLAWLIRAFDVLNTPDLVAMVLPLKNQLLEFGEDTLNHPDRRVRRRLRELVKRVQIGVVPPPAAKVERDVDETPVDEPIAAHALSALAALVRKQTEGRKVLFVSNREDPELGVRLTDLLGIHITWCDGSLRRVQAQCERIKGKSYDLILSATGFQVHGVDSALARAAGGVDVPYVRVNRGRPVACVQAIAREFGIVTGEYPRLDRHPKASSG